MLYCQYHIKSYCNQSQDLCGEIRVLLGRTVKTDPCLTVAEFQTCANYSHANTHRE
jgi:hypothetical protein